MTEVSGQYPDYGCRHGIQRDRLPDDRRIGAEAAAPESVAQQRDASGAGTIVFSRKQATQTRLQSQAGEIVARDGLCVDNLRLIAQFLRLVRAVAQTQTNH